MEITNLYVEPHFLHKELSYGFLSNEVRKELRQIAEAAYKTPILNNSMTVAILWSEYIVDYIIKHKLPSIEERFSTGQLKEGNLVWTLRTFQFKGTYAAARQRDEGIDPAYATFYTLASDKISSKLVGQFNVKHLYSSSSFNMLAGRSKKYLLGYVDSISKSKIEIRPVLIGNCYSKENPIQVSLHAQLYCPVEDIAELAEIRKVSRRSVYPYLHLNKGIPEKTMKEWIASIIGTPDVPNDWGGEKSDLFVPLTVNGKTLKAAFLLKGPAKFHKLEIRHLGKPGNQLVRLYSEPAQIYILIHCHEVSPDIIKNMEIFSSSIHKPSCYCVLDGYDALRIWKAYGKLPMSRFRRDSKLKK